MNKPDLGLVIHAILKRRDTPRDCRLRNLINPNGGDTLRFPGLWFQNERLTVGDLKQVLHYVKCSLCTKHTSLWPRHLFPTITKIQWLVIRHLASLQPGHVTSSGLCSKRDVGELINITCLMSFCNLCCRFYQPIS